MSIWNSNYFQHATYTGSSYFSNSSRTNTYECFTTVACSRQWTATKTHNQTPTNLTPGKRMQRRVTGAHGCFKRDFVRFLKISNQHFDIGALHQMDGIAWQITCKTNFEIRTVQTRFTLNQRELMSSLYAIDCLHSTLNLEAIYEGGLEKKKKDRIRSTQKLRSDPPMAYICTAPILSGKYLIFRSFISLRF